MIQFPAVNINFKNWPELEDTNFLFDEFIYTKNIDIFKTYFENQYYADSRGKVFRLIAKKPPYELWRRLLRFLPNVFKVTLIFEPTDKTLSLNEFKHMLIGGINTYEQDEFTEAWKLNIENSDSIEKIMNYEHEQ